MNKRVSDKRFKNITDMINLKVGKKYHLLSERIRVIKEEITKLGDGQFKKEYTIKYIKSKEYGKISFNYK